MFITIILHKLLSKTVKTVCYCQLTSSSNSKAVYSLNKYGNYIFVSLQTNWKLGILNCQIKNYLYLFRE